MLQPIDPNTNAAATKLATNFNTNRTYINEAARLKQGREKQKESGKLYGENHQKQEVLSIIDKTSEEEPHNTRNIISSEIGKSTGWVGMAEVEADEIVEAIKAETERQRREKISEAAEIRERSESGTFTRSNNLLLQPIDPKPSGREGRSRRIHRASQ